MIGSEYKPEMVTQRAPGGVARRLRRRASESVAVASMCTAIGPLNPLMKIDDCIYFVRELNVYVYVYVYVNLFHSVSLGQISRTDLGKSSIKCSQLATSFLVRFVEIRAANRVFVAIFISSGGAKISTSRLIESQ